MVMYLWKGGGGELPPKHLGIQMLVMYSSKIFRLVKKVFSYDAYDSVVSNDALELVCQRFINWCGQLVVQSFCK